MSYISNERGANKVVLWPNFGHRNQCILGENRRKTHLATSGIAHGKGGMST